MHYRMSVYNYFYDHFGESGYEFSVIADCVQPGNHIVPRFTLTELPFCFRDYRRAITAVAPDAVILFLRLRDAILWPLLHWLKLRGIPFAIWTKGGNWDKQTSVVRYHLFNYVHGLADALILYSTACRRFLKARYLRKCFVANNTLNFHDFPVVNDDKATIRSDYGIPFARVALFVGRMDAERGRKRVGDLIDVFAQLERDDVGLVLVGAGLSADLQRRLNPRNTRYLGEVQDSRNYEISRLCKMSDICVIPGHAGLGINQAFFWGLPVITEDGSHPPEIAYLTPGRNGFIVPCGDLNSLRDRICFLFDNDAVRAGMSRNAQDDILREAPIEGMFAGFKNCVDYLVQKR